MAKWSLENLGGTLGIVCLNRAAIKNTIWNKFRDKQLLV